MPESYKCLNHETCKGYTIGSEKFCDACRAAGYGSNLYNLYVDKHENEKHGGRASKFPQNGNKK